MNQQMKVFNHEQFGNVRIIEEDGKVLFCAVDIARALGYSNTRDATGRHCKGVVKRDGVSMTTNQHGTSTKQVNLMSFIPEGDVYRLITHSKLPSAERFERWVFDEVLPSIRRTGGYGQQLNMELVAQIITMTVQATVKELLPAHNAGEKAGTRAQGSTGSRKQPAPSGARSEPVQDSIQRLRGSGHRAFTAAQDQPRNTRLSV